MRCPVPLLIVRTAIMSVGDMGDMAAGEGNTTKVSAGYHSMTAYLSIPKTAGYDWQRTRIMFPYKKYGPKRSRRAGHSMIIKTADASSWKWQAIG